MNNSKALYKLKRLSFFASITTVFWFLFFALVSIHQWWGNYLPITRYVFGNDLVAFWSLNFGQKFIGSFGIFLTIGIVFMIIKYLNKFLANCKNGTIFETSSFQYLHKMIRWLIAYALWVPANVTLETLVKTWHLPKGQRLLSISAGTDDLLHIIGIFFLSLIAIILKEGIALKLENESVI